MLKLEYGWYCYHGFVLGPSNYSQNSSVTVTIFNLLWPSYELMGGKVKMTNGVNGYRWQNNVKEVLFWLSPTLVEVSVLDQESK